MARHLNEIRSELDGVMSRIDELIEKEDRTEEETTELPELEAKADKLLAEETEARKREERKREFKAIPKDEPIEKLQVEVTKEERTYRPDRSSYWHDLYMATLQGDPASRQRLERNNLEVRDLTRTDTSSVGEFVPPAWLLELYQAGLRAEGRVTANRCTQIALPGGTDSINLPRISTNPTVAAQTADNATVNEVDTVSATVTAPVRTFAGQNDVAIQVLEQSPIGGGFDQVIFQELTSDINRYTDLQVLNGAGTSGEITGIIGTSGIKDTNYTDASPTVPELFPSFGKILSLVTSARLAPVECMVMHPRRWYWLTAGLDSSNRPYVTPTINGPQNAYGVQDGGGAGLAEGLVGFIAGVPVYIDPNVPTTLNTGGGGATEDIVVAGRFSDAILFEGGLRTRVLPEVLSGTLTVRLQVYRYVAFTAARAGGVGFGTISDTGMAAPSGF